MEDTRVAGGYYFRPLPGIWAIVAMFFLSGLYFGLWALPGLVLFLSFLHKKRLLKRLSIYIGLVAFFCLCGIILSRPMRFWHEEALPKGAFLTVSGRVVEVIPGQENNMLLLCQKAMADGRVFPFHKLINVYKKGLWPKRFIGCVVTLDIIKSKHVFFYRPSFIVSRPDIFTPVFKWLSALRHKAFGMAKNGLSPLQRSVLMAVFLGQKDDLYYQYRNRFYDFGVGHILAISGLHIGLLMGSLYLLFSLLNMGYRAKHIALLLFCLVYISVAGWWSMSLVRAGIMFVIWALARLLRRELSIYDLLGLAVIVIGLIDSRMLFSVGFQLSAMAVLMIALSVGLFGRYMDLGYFSSMFLVSISVFLGLLGLVVLYFGKVAWMAPFVNLIFVPLLFLLIVSGLIFFLSFGVISMPVKIVTDFLFKASDGMSFLRPIVLSVEGYSNVVVLFYYLAVFIGLLFFMRAQLTEE